jgi:hypothetical protein
MWNIMANLFRASLNECFTSDGKANLFIKVLTQLNHKGAAIGSFMMCTLLLKWAIETIRVRRRRRSCQFCSYANRDSWIPELEKGNFFAVNISLIFLTSFFAVTSAKTLIYILELWQGLETQQNATPTYVTFFLASAEKLMIQIIKQNRSFSYSFVLQI